MSGGGALICGGSSCTVADLEFPAGINHKLLFKINTMINTVCGTSMPAENCTGPVRKGGVGRGIGSVFLKKGGSHEDSAK